MDAVKGDTARCDGGYEREGGGWGGVSAHLPTSTLHVGGVDELQARVFGVLVSWWWGRPPVCDMLLIRSLAC